MNEQILTTQIQELYLSSRYQRGSRSLAVNLSQSAAAGKVLDVKPDLGSISPEEDYDIPEEVENVIGTFDFYQKANH